MRKVILLCLALVAGSALSGCATGPDITTNDPNDPFEAMNRRLFEASLSTDRYFVRPLAQAYRGVVPKPIRSSIRNFLNNLDSPMIFTNDVLQGELERAGITVARFGINTTVGVGGLFEVAEGWGLERHSEDFGQTLGVYGVGDGPYLFLPILGPGNPRDLIGYGVDFLFDPLSYVHYGDKWFIPYTRFTIDMVDVRERNIETLDDIQRSSADFYARVKSLYRQNRADEIRNGETEGEELPDF